MPSKDAEKLFALTNSLLLAKSPVLSGNMQSHITTTQNGEEFVIIIDAPYYDLDIWNKEKRIVHTGENNNGKTAYAQDVNEAGAFGRFNKSMHWVNRVCYESASAIANEIGAVVDNRLEL